MTTDVQAIAEQRASRVRWSILGLMCTAAGIAYLQRNSVSVPSQQIESDLGISKTELGQIMAAFYWGYAAMQIPSGWLSDRWGNRNALTLFALTWSLATASIAMTTSPTGFYLSWFLAGAAQAGAFPCATSALAIWMPSSTRAFSSGALAASMNLGAAVATSIAGLILLELGWREMFVIAALPGVAWAMLYFYWFRNTPEQHQSVNAAELQKIHGSAPARASQTVARAKLDWSRLLLNPNLWAICGQQFFRASGYIFLATWFPRYLQEERGISIAASGFLSSVPLLSTVAGSLAGGVVADRLLIATGSRRLSRQGTAAAGMLACAALVGSSLAIHDAHAAVALISAGAFCAFFGGVSSYAITMDLGGRYVATVFALMNMSGNIGAALMPDAIGRVLQRTGNWSYVIWMIAGAYIASAICWLLIDPNRSLVDSPDEEQTE